MLWVLRIKVDQSRFLNNFFSVIWVIRCISIVILWFNWLILCKNLLTLRQNCKLVYPHWACGEPCSAVPHFDGPTVDGSGHRVHEASQGCLSQCNVLYKLVHRSKFGVPRAHCIDIWWHVHTLSPMTSNVQLMRHVLSRLCVMCRAACMSHTKWLVHRAARVSCIEQLVYLTSSETRNARS